MSFCDEVWYSPIILSSTSQNCQSQELKYYAKIVFLKKISGMTGYPKFLHDNGYLPLAPSGARVMLDKVFLCV